jgi:5-carboxymethyl-2-hydroxymuconate isomerase
VIPQQGTAEEKLAAFVREYVRTQLRTSEGRSYSYATLVMSLGVEWRSELRRIERQISGLLRDILQQGVDEGIFHVRDVRVAAFAVSNACEYVFTWYRSAGDLSEEVVCDTYVDMMLKMVGAGSSTAQGSVSR